MAISNKGLDNLIVWKKAVELVQLIYQDIIEKLPPDERWSMTQQLRRSSLSIPANIAEGYGRYNHQDHVRFCYIARGSLEETYSHIQVAIAVGYIKPSDTIRVDPAIIELKKVLNGYIQFIKKSKHNDSEPDKARYQHMKETQGFYQDDPDQDGQTGYET